MIELCYTDIHMNMKKEKVLVLISIYLYIVVYVTRKDLEIFIFLLFFLRNKKKCFSSRFMFITNLDSLNNQFVFPPLWH